MPRNSAQPDDKCDSEAAIAHNLGQACVGYVRSLQFTTSRATTILEGTVHDVMVGGQYRDLGVAVRTRNCQFRLPRFLRTRCRSQPRSPTPVRTGWRRFRGRIAGKVSAIVGIEGERDSQVERRSRTRPQLEQANRP